MVFFKGVFFQSLFVWEILSAQQVKRSYRDSYLVFTGGRGCKYSCSWKVVAVWKGSAATGIGRFGFLLSPLQEMESPAKKRLRTVAKPSILTQPEGKSVGPTKKKVTFDSNLTQCAKEGSSKTIQPVTKAMSLKETADIVVKYLTPFYKGGKFASKVGYSSRPSLTEGKFISLGIWGSEEGEVIWIPPFISSYVLLCAVLVTPGAATPLSHKRVGVCWFHTSL